VADIKRSKASYIFDGLTSDVLPDVTSVADPGWRACHGNARSRSPYPLIRLAMIERIFS